MKLTKPILLLLTGVVAASKGLSGGETAHDLESKEFVQETPSLRRRLKSCSDHWHCPEHERCNRNNKCVPNYTADKARRRCTDNYGCPTKERCTRGWCELKPKYADTCDDNWECKTGETCYNGKCELFDNASVKTSCGSNNWWRCGPDETCYNGRCERTQDVQTLYCYDDMDCPSDDKCISYGSYGRCEHPSCDFNSDCPRGKRCKRRLHKCV